ncbi:amidase domain-containing protein [Paenibacillus sp. N1-5-1-14]|uniref:amidase domain-containing protein n=1 Tax=Paenibacillus radicibacter TaxID=2972488 RepID=UPI002159A1EC|nr:amidase domain-containing protein [Paenibacillus radicibacter]MCR8644998.1 amidase domain-containing protein [Paenibacillus radicibacter]
MKKTMIHLCIMMMLTSIISASSVRAYTAPQADKQEVTNFLANLYAARNQFIKSGDPSAIQPYYDSKNATSKGAMEQELHRTHYLITWAEKRGIVLTDATASINLTRYNQEGSTVKVALFQTSKISYQYKERPDIAVQSFGVGTRHALTLRHAANGWQVIGEWYLDPMDENPDLIAPEHIAGFPNPDIIRHSQHTQSAAQKKRFNREQAIAYATKYAGAAWGTGNNGKYNTKYRDYTYLGGDCTNFSSQVIGDPLEGGGLAMTEQWKYILHEGGSRAWIQTDRFKDFLLYNGYASLITTGTFSDIVKRTIKHPQGAIAKLVPGDLIAYMLEGNVDHFSIFVGYDSNGYPLVNSHTADRYRVPFDLGWDQTTQYLLIHIKD